MDDIDTIRRARHNALDSDRGERDEEAFWRGEKCRPQPPLGLSRRVSVGGIIEGDVVMIQSTHGVVRLWEVHECCGEEVELKVFKDGSI